MKAMRIPLCLIAAALFLAPAGWSDDFSSVEKSIVKAMKKTKSLKARYTTKSDIKSDSFKSAMDGDGTLEYRRAGERVLFRSESTFSSTTEVGGNVTKSEGTSLIIDDGKFTFTYSVMGGQKSATKTKSMNAWNVNPFNAWREQWDLKPLPSESIDGASCYVIEATPKAGSATAAAGGKMRMHFRKDCGLSVKMVTYDKSGKVTMTSTSSDVEVNPSIADDRFVFKAPAGVEVVDMVAMQEQAEQAQRDAQAQQASDKQAASGDAKKSDEKPKAEKKKSEKKSEKKAEAKKPAKKKKGLGLPKLPKWKKKP